MQPSSTGSWVIFCSTLALAALGCGDDSDGNGSCSAFAACGGDPNGVWLSSNICLPDDVGVSLGADLPPECQDAIVLDEATSNTTLTIADGTFTEEGTATLQWSMRFDTDCIGAVAGGVAVDGAAIAAFCDGVSQSLESMETPFAESSCQAIDRACSCSARQQPTINQSGSVVVEGSTLVYEGGVRQDFCVNGDRLDLASVEGGALEEAHLVYERAAP